jgi:hypothetical protein
MAQFFIVFCSTAQAQFSARNLMENQYGKLPDTDQSNFSSLYNKLIVNYRFDDLKVPLEYKPFKHLLPAGITSTPPGWVSITKKNH